ncbi:MAG: CrcB family protein, partial [Desulfovibrionaceae bacterium]|nr:CrcB family protein [Desulfovibrionaceae bacterium]
MFHLAVCVMLGGALGSACRYLTDTLLSNLDIPFTLLWINGCGCFFMGFFRSLSIRKHIADSLSAGIGTGFLGSFTTVSAYAAETLSHLLSKNSTSALFTIFFHAVFCL